MICPSCQAENQASAESCASCGLSLTRVPTLASTIALSEGTAFVTLDLKPGTVFHSRYEILGPLGKGGMGVVFRARDRTLDELVAIKVLRPDYAQEPTMADRFKSEIKLARKVRHRNVCTIHDFGEDRGVLYISMELIEGVDLKRMLREGGGLPPDKGYDLAIQLAEGLQAVHDAGIVHRDLKAPNIMIDDHGVARLMDFGVAKRVGEGTLTAAGHIVGTPEYLSPEQAQGRKADFRSDIYAFGIVLYEIFSGHVPFRGETPISTILKHINDPPPLEGPAAAGIPKELKPVLRRALAKDPRDRYGSARDVAEALRRAHAAARREELPTTEVMRAPAPRYPPQPSRSRALQPWLLALPLVAAAAGVVALRGRLVQSTGPIPDTVPSVPPSLAAPPETAPAGASETGMAPSTVTPPARVPPEVRSTPPSPAAVASSATPSGVTLPRPAAVPASTLPRTSDRPAVRVPPPPVTKPATSLAPTPRAASPSPAPRQISPSPAPSPPAPAEPGHLLVAVRPWGTVSIDGKVVGDTPLDKIPLSPGGHVVRVRYPGYEVWERTITVRSGQTEKVFVDFATLGVRKP